MGGEGASFVRPRMGWRVVVAVVLAAVVVVMVIVARLSGGSSAQDRPGGAAVQPSATVTAAPSPTGSPLPNDGVAGAPASPYSQRAAPGAVKAALAFTRAWADHPAGLSAQQWWSAVSRHADPALAKQLQFTDPARVPASKVTGDAEGVAGGVSSATVAVPTDGGRVVLTCVLVRDRWLVSDIDLERGPQ